MFSLYTTPAWFQGYDIILDIIGLLISLLIAAYSFRIYKSSRENRFAYLSLTFILLAFGFTFKAVTNAILYFTPIRDIAAVVLAPVAGEGLAFSDLLYRGAFFLEMISFLGGWLLLFFISQKARSRLHRWHEVSQIALFIYLLLLISVVSNFKFIVFYLTSTVLLSLTVLNYYKNYLNTSKSTARNVMVAFTFIFAGNLLSIFVFLKDTFYVAAEILQLIGFLILLITYRQITKK